MARTLFVASVVFVCHLATCFFGFSQEPAPELRVDATAQAAGAGQWDIRADLGEVPAVPVVQIVLSVKNPTDEDLVLGNTFSGCKCLKATLSREVIKPNKTEEIKLTLTVDKQKRELSRWVLLTLAPNEAPDRNTRIHIKYRVAGMLLFSQDSAAFEFPEGGKQMNLQVPIMFTPPIEPRDIVVYGKGALSGLKGEIESKGSVFHASFNVESKMVGSGVSGWLVVENPKTGQSDTINCIIDLRKRLECVPTVLQFRWSEEQNIWIANALIRVTADEEAKPQLVSSSEMRVIARADNAKIDCKVKQLKNGVARVELRSEFDMNKLSNERDLKKITWFIDYDGNEYRDSNRFVLTR